MEKLLPMCSNSFCELGLPLRPAGGGVISHSSFLDSTREKSKVSSPLHTEGIPGVVPITLKGYTIMATDPKKTGVASSYPISVGIDLI